MLRSETRTIDGLEVTTQQLPATRAYRFAARLSKLLLPIAGAVKGRSLDDAMSLGVETFAPLLQQLDEPTLDALLLESLQCTSVMTVDAKGVPIKYDLTTKPMIDLAFGGNVGALLRTMMFAIEFNFRDFFSASVGPGLPTPTPSS